MSGNRKTIVLHLPFLILICLCGKTTSGIGIGTNASAFLADDYAIHYMDNFTWSQRHFPLEDSLRTGIWVFGQYTSIDAGPDATLTTEVLFLDPNVFYITYAGQLSDWLEDPFYEPGYERPDVVHPTPYGGTIHSVWYIKPRVGYSWQDHPSGYLQMNGTACNNSGGIGACIGWGHGFIFDVVDKLYSWPRSPENMDFESGWPDWVSGGQLQYHPNILGGGNYLNAEVNPSVGKFPAVFDKPFKAGTISFDAYLPFNVQGRVRFNISEDGSSYYKVQTGYDLQTSNDDVRLSRIQDGEVTTLGYGPPPYEHFASVHLDIERDPNGQIIVSSLGEIIISVSDPNLTYTSSVIFSHDENANNHKPEYGFDNIDIQPITDAAPEIQVRDGEVQIEEGTTGMLLARLSGKPVSDVTLGIVFSDGDFDLNLDEPVVELVFTPLDWFEYQPVNIGAGEDDDAVEGCAHFRVYPISGPESLAEVTVTACEIDIDENLNADINDDGKVDARDFSILALSWESCGCGPSNSYCLAGDLNLSGCVDIADLLIFSNHWLRKERFMRSIVGGEFSMGDHYDVGQSDERPVHSVYVSDFFMGATEVTNEAYCEFLNSALDLERVTVGPDNVVYDPCVGSRPYCDTNASSSQSRIVYDGQVFTVQADKKRHPMIKVSWYGAAAYCNWFSVEEALEQCYDPYSWTCDFSKNGYRLATEAEWELAARGGDHDPYTMYPWGNDPNEQNVNLLNSGDPYESGPEPHTTPVMLYSPNGYGLYDMLGNVWEHCYDRYDATYYQTSPYMNPTGPESAPDTTRRGGGWSSSWNYCRIASRDAYSFTARSHNTGFRLARPRLAPMVYIEAGSFPYANLNADFPDLWVDVDGFYIDKYEVTNGSYCLFLNEADAQGDHYQSGMEIIQSGSAGNFTYEITPGKSEYPVRYASYCDAQEFAVWRSQREGVTYRLPTGQEWEKAAAWDPEEPNYYLYGCHQETIDQTWCNYGGHVGTTTERGYYDGSGGRENARSYYGCYDMTGNVWEWTLQESYDNPDKRVLKGGSYVSSEDHCRTVFGATERQDVRSYNFGFRLVCPK